MTRTFSRIGYPIAGIALVIIAWVLICWIGNLPTVVLPTPDKVVRAFVSRFPLLVSEGWITLKETLFAMLGGHPGEVELTENFAMLPTSAVSGFYFAHRDCDYFGVARIGRDQLEDYAERRGVPVEQAERWLRPNLD